MSRHDPSAARPSRESAPAAAAPGRVGRPRPICGCRRRPTSCGRWISKGNSGRAMGACVIRSRCATGTVGLSCGAPRCRPCGGSTPRRSCGAPLREYGLPERIRSDNGPPFGSPTSLARLSRLAVWWLRLGVWPERITPGRPQQNGAHEQFHRVLKRETACPPAASRRAQQRRFRTFVTEYNDERPHEALNQTPPATRYTPSSRPLPRRVPRPEYPAGWDVRRVLRWRRDQVGRPSALSDSRVSGGRRGARAGGRRRVAGALCRATARRLSRTRVDPAAARP